MMTDRFWIFFSQLFYSDSFTERLLENENVFAAKMIQLQWRMHSSSMLHNENKTENFTDPTTESKNNNNCKI